MRYFPLFLDLRGRPVLVAGGGGVAERKVKLLVASGAQVTVVAPVLCPALARRVARGEIRHRAGEFSGSDLESQRWVIAATNRSAVNREIAAAAEARGLFVNVVDDAELSTAIMPAIVDRSPLMIAVASGGGAPMLARLVREQLEALLDQSWGRVAQFLGAWRSRIRARFDTSRERRVVLPRVARGADHGTCAPRTRGRRRAGARRAPGCAVRSSAAGQRDSGRGRSRRSGTFDAARAARSE